ncbi:CMD domain protein [Microbacterium sp.]|uniref:CMD domain protein n=1 Tax=Microbacterium sp. TaxID=51671 RepID=UPI003F9AA8BD
MTDVVDSIVGVRPGDALDALRARRPEARRNAQAAYEALFVGVDETHASLAERRAVGLFVALLHRQSAVAEHYGDLLSEQDEELAEAVAGASDDGEAEGPYGGFDGPLADESVEGPTYRVADRAAMGERLSAALEHAHLLTFHPRDAKREHLQALLDAGWTTTGAVTLSQLIAFLAFQIRLVHGLAVLGRRGVNVSDIDADRLAAATAAAQEGEEA